MLCFRRLLRDWLHLYELSQRARVRGSSEPSGSGCAGTKSGSFSTQGRGGPWRAFGTWNRPWTDSSPCHSRRLCFSQGSEDAKHKKGCHCKRSGCLKKYCECFQGGVSCSDLCRCINCMNDGLARDGRSSFQRSRAESNLSSDPKRRKFGPTELERSPNLLASAGLAGYPPSLFARTPSSPASAARSSHRGGPISLCLVESGCHRLLRVADEELRNVDRAGSLSNALGETNPLLCDERSVDPEAESDPFVVVERAILTECTRILQEYYQMLCSSIPSGGPSEVLGQRAFPASEI